MSIDPVPHSLYPVASAPGATAAHRAAHAGHVGKPFETLYAEAAKAPAELDPGPSADALTAVQVAAQAYEMLKQHGRELRFRADHGLMRIEVYDGTGQLVRSIPPNEALALAAGETSWQA